MQHYELQILWCAALDYKAPARGRLVRCVHGHTANLVLDNLPKLGLWHAGLDVAEEHFLGADLVMSMALGSLVPPLAAMGQGALRDP